MKRVILTSLFSLLMAGAATAGEFYVLDLGDAHMRAGRGDDTIRIKQQMRSQYPRVRLRKADLLSVVLVAKTKHGRGSAELLVGQSYSQAERVGGEPGTFRTTAEQSYDRVLFKNPAQSSRGKWQIKLRGNFKINQVVVEVDANPAQDLALAYHDVHMRSGQGQDTLFLKRKMQELGLSARDYKLMGVTVIGKSKQGRGTATLKVGQSLSSAQTLGGNPRKFQSNADRTYSEVYFANSLGQGGAWQVKLRGNIKIKSVILHVKAK